MIRSRKLCAALVALTFVSNLTFAQGTAFSYQGQLANGGLPVNGSYDLQFTLYSTNTGGIALAGPVTNSATTVSNGLFVTTIDFGPGVFTGNNCWLDIAVSTNGAGLFVELTPRQFITSMPDAIFANTASNLLGTLAGNGSALTNLNYGNIVNPPVIPSTNGFVTAGITNGLATTNFVISQGYLTSANGGNATLATNVVGGINITNAFITNSVFAGNGGQLTNLNYGNIVNPPVVPSTNGFVTSSVTNGLATTNFVTSRGYLISASGTSITNAFITNSVFSGDGHGLTNLNASQIFGASAALAVTNLSVSGTNQIAPLSVPPSLPASAIGSAGTGATPGSIALAGRYAYVVNGGSNTLQVFDVSIPSNPVLISSVATGSGPAIVATAGRYAYVINSSGASLQIFDVSDPANMVLTGSATTGSFPQGLAVAGRYAYVVNGGNSLQVFDVGNPSNPTLVGTAAAGGNSYFVVISGRYAYVINQGGTMQAFDVSDPTNPTLVDSVSTAPQPVCAAVSGSYAYVVNFNSGVLQAFNVSNPSNMVSAGSVSIGGNSIYVTVSGRYAYVLNQGGANSMHVFDISTPSTPVSVGSVNTGSGPRAVDISGRYAYVVNQTANTLQVFNLGGAYVQQLEAGAAEVGTLQTRDTATVGNSLDVRGGLTVSASARISGSLSVNNGTITATNFSGNGSGLTNLSAAQISGTLSAAQLPAVAVTNGASGISLTGAFYGNGAGLTNLGVNSANVALLNAANTFTGGSNIFNGSVGIGTSSPIQSLDVNGNINIQGTHLVYDSANGVIEWGSGGSLLFRTDSSNGNINTYTQQMSLDASGNLVVSDNITCTAINITSDRNAKEDFKPVSPRDVLAKVSALPISEWQYKSEKAGDAEAARHIGPMAQDFSAAFALGRDDKHISVVDEGGVALAAIQGLNEKLDQKDAQIRELEKSVAELRSLVNQLSHQTNGGAQ